MRIKEDLNKRDMFNLIRCDFYEWCRWRNWNANIKTFMKLFFLFPEYRYLVGVRLRMGGVKFIACICRFSARYHKLQIDDSPGKGFRIMHGFSTIVNCKKMGDYCLVSQLVTIGWGKGGTPVIGNNVEIYAGAIIIGGITIGDNVKIGAGAVVVNDIPSDCTVVGNPARIIRHKNNG